MIVPVKIKNEISVLVEDLPEKARGYIRSALSFPNEEKQVNQREQIFGWWDLPDTVDLWREEDRGDGLKLIMPRGFASDLVKGLSGLNADIQWDDQRNGTKASEPFRQFVFEPRRDYQLEAIISCLKAQQGFYECPAGGGKTVTALGLAAISGYRTLIIIDKADIVDQWIEEAANPQFLNYRAGKIGQGVWEERDLTIALRQSLWSKINELDLTNWWDQWGWTWYDEGHHLSGETLEQISRRCTSMGMMGTSATPAKSETRGKIVHALVGPIVHRTSRKVLRERGILIQPSVEKIYTPFEAASWDTHTVPADRDCKVPKCPKKGKEHTHRNNYSSVLKKVVESKERNAIIGKRVVAERGHIHLLPSRQLKHLELLKKAIIDAGWDGPIFFLRGEENARGESRSIVEEIRQSHEAVIFSTVADEALNIPPIDRVWLTFPGRQDAGTEQLIGRGERAWPGKEETIVRDLVDEKVEVLLNQSFERDRTYRRLGCRIKGERDGADG